MPIDFPANPTNGQVYGNWIWDSSITSWRNVNTDTGIGTLNAMGLKNVVPTSVAVGSGSATVNANGLVTFSGASSISLNGVFTSTYKNYRITVRVKQGGSGSTGVNATFRTSGTNRTTGYFWGGYIAYVSNTLNAYSSNNGGSFLAGFANTSSTSSAVLDIFYPAEASELTTFHTQSIGSDGNYFSLNNSGYQGTTEAHDGISLTSTSGTWTGQVQVFGYNQ